MKNLIINILLILAYTTWIYMLIGIITGYTCKILYIIKDKNAQANYSMQALIFSIVSGLLISYYHFQ